MDEFLTKGLTATALESGQMFRNPSDKLLQPLAHDVQCTSNDYINLLGEHEIDISTSRKCDCFDNPCVDFFASLKKELVYRCRFETREEAKIKIWEHIPFFIMQTYSLYSWLRIANDYERFF